MMTFRAIVSDDDSLGGRKPFLLLLPLVSVFTFSGSLRYTIFPVRAEKSIPLKTRILKATQLLISRFTHPYKLT